jgi:hypothetical protein
MANANQKSTPEAGSGLYDLWRRPAITSGVTLGALILGTKSMSLGVVGLLFLWPVSPLVGAVTFAVGIALGYLSYRLFRSAA